MHKKVVSLVLAISLVGGLSLSAFASPNEDNQKSIINEQKDKLKQNKQQLDKNKSLYEDALKVVQGIESNIEMLDNKIEGIQAEISANNNKISNAEEKINLTKMELDKSNEEIKKEQELFNERVSTLYMNGTGSYLEVILDSKGLMDFISRAENLKDIAEYDKKIIDDLNGKREAIEKKKQDLEYEKENLLALKKDKESKLGEVQKARGEQQTLIAEANKKKEYYASTVSEYNEKIKEAQSSIDSAMKKIEQMKTSVPKYRPSRGGNVGVGAANLSSNSVVSYASNFIGTPYEWGATGPNTFDCSGFVQYVYGHFGVGLSRTTYTQINEGSYVSRGELEAGDLVFFGTGSNPHHVGIYVGDGCYIHAPRTGDSVKVSSLSARGDFICGRRIR